MKHALSFIFKGRKNTFLFPIISVAISVVSVVIISTVGVVGKEAVNREVSNLGIGNLMVSSNEFSETKLTQNELDKIKECETVKLASPIIYEYSQLKSYKGNKECLIWGLDENSEMTMNLPVIYGRNISKYDIEFQQKVCLVEKDFAKENYGRENIVGKKLSVFVSEGFDEYTVIGVTDNEQSLIKNVVSAYVPGFVYVPFTVLRQTSGDDIFSAIAVTVNSNVDIEGACDNINAVLCDHLGNGYGYKVENVMAHSETIQNILNIITTVLSGIAGISLIVSGISVMTVMMFSVSERTHEIGIKKALGASYFDIFFEFLVEAIVITLIGCATGTALGIAASYIGLETVSMPIEFDYNMIGICVVVTAAFGLIFGIYPAICAARLEPATALRRK